MRTLLVHGFTQNAGCFGAFAERLQDPAGRANEIYTVDLPGHGHSSDISAGPWAAAEMLGLSFGKGTYIGYSLGARICLHLALSNPDIVERLVLISANGGIEDGVARNRRRVSDEAMARELEEGKDLEAFLHDWTEQPLFATMPQHARMIDRRMQNTPVGLASSLRMCGAAACDPLWDRLHELAMPVLIVAGMLDSRYAYAADRMARLIGDNARVSLIPGAGHACHLERPGTVALIITSFLRAIKVDGD
ncbi:MAG: alpha/beta fold hydrolase [Actinobacteria bacterium]|jgi:2-succinyl-6-hydroxy-2,4-cyclohexadiene-1-carboxylate synthase|nr:alpha/beta fold hydrolase [Actinomycetota bacterium]